MNKILELNDNGLYCKKGDFYIDPWNPVDKALITHGHADHSRWGSKHYLATKDSEFIMRHRLGEIDLQTVEYGEKLNINGVYVSFHPAGHILGSAQIRLELDGYVVVVSGDYKLESDKTCEDFEPVKCNSFITESTFGLPIYEWEEESKVFDKVNTWWQKNKEAGKTSIIYSYALGKAQRILANLDNSIGEIYTHGAVENMNKCYKLAGINLPQTTYLGQGKSRKDFEGSLVIAPLSSDNTSWIRKFRNPSTAFASGWMQVRGQRRRRAADRGFVLSDHADWKGLLTAIKATEAEEVYVTHGYSEILSKYLNYKGIYSKPLETQYTGENEDSSGEKE